VKLLALGTILLTAAPAFAGPNLVQNGGFELTTHGPDAFVGVGISDPLDWSGGGIAAIYSPGAADATGANQGPYQVYLWGPNNPTAGCVVSVCNSLNGLPSTSPAGGNYLAADSQSAFDVPLTQTVSGLQVGGTYDLSFYYAAAQFRFFDGSLWNGPTDSFWQVSLGSQTFDTQDLSIASHGFSGWKLGGFTFTATSPTEVLSFLASSNVGSVNLPPVALLDGVSLSTPSSTPEPSTWAMMLLGFAGLGYAGYRSRRVAATAA
jgi:hypothetical protein